MAARGAGVVVRSEHARETGSPDRLKLPTITAERTPMSSGTAVQDTTTAAAALVAPGDGPRRGDPSTSQPEGDVQPQPATPAAPRQATYAQVFALREFRTLFLADLVSLIGDQVAAVAVSFLLYQRSGSALLAALGYATAYAPWFLGGPVLATWAERLPPRAVMVGCDVIRAALIGLAALPGLPLPVVALLVLGAALLAPPFDAVNSAVMVEALPGDTYPVGASVRAVVHQLAQLTGFAGGGALIALIGTHEALALDAASFAVSALIVRTGLRARPAPQGDPVDADDAPAGLWRDMVGGLRAVATQPGLRVPLLLSMVVASCVIVPEAIATAYADELGGGPVVVGLIMASTAAGAALGALVTGRMLPPALRLRLLGPMCVAACLPLLGTLAQPGVAVSMALFFLAGAASSVTVVASTLFGRAAAPEMRSRCFAIAMAGLYGGQTLGIVLAGLLALVLSAAHVIALAGVVGGLACLAMLRSVRAVVASAADDQVAAA